MPRYPATLILATTLLSFMPVFRAKAADSAPAQTVENACVVGNAEKTPFPGVMREESVKPDAFLSFLERACGNPALARALRNAAGSGLRVRVTTTFSFATDAVAFVDIDATDDDTISHLNTSAENSWRMRALEARARDIGVARGLVSAELFSSFLTRAENNAELKAAIRAANRDGIRIVLMSFFKESSHTIFIDPRETDARIAAFIREKTKTP